MSSIEAALAAIESLELGKQFSHRKIAAEYHCSRATLALRRQEINALSIPSKRKSSYAILSVLQGKAYLLHGL
jgi:predicted transcriptional regulator